jgi:ThiF family
MSTLRSRSASRTTLEHPQLVPYAPVLQRTNDEVQVGVHPQAALVFRGEGIGILLTLLNGSQPISAVRRAARAAGLSKPQVTWALGALDAAGLLTERGAAAYTEALAPLQVRLIGAGPVGSQIARVLAASGLGTLYVYDNEPPDLALYPSAGVLTSRAEALRSALADSGSTISTLSHWSKPEAAPLDLTIVACDSPELDRVITDHLLRIDQPHLLVRCWGNGVSVGPLVLAGQTSCLRCADMARSDADPRWPIVLTQLSRLHLESPPALLAWAASVAAAQALAFLHGELPESAGATLELSWPDFVTRLRRWPAHPSCGCGWLSHTE